MFIKTFDNCQKFCFCWIFVFNQTELLAIAEGPVWLTAKIQQKHNFWQLPKVNCESHYCEIRVSRFSLFPILILHSQTSHFAIKMFFIQTIIDNN
jgi:hypothetical protein